jgi:HAE1 family hydrophobic/amphiphilic exporter-1
MLMLVGIVVTNAIVLLDLINTYRRDGMPIEAAVIEGGRHRVRPILMTAIATVCALTPMAVGLSDSGGGFISGPLAVVVIGGLLSSTVLTLALVPALYTSIELRTARRTARREARRTAGRPIRRKRRGAWATAAGPKDPMVNGSAVPSPETVQAAVFAAAASGSWNAFEREL